MAGRVRCGKGSVSVAVLGAVPTGEPVSKRDPETLKAQHAKVLETDARMGCPEQSRTSRASGPGRVTQGTGHWSLTGGVDKKPFGGPKTLQTADRLQGASSISIIIISILEVTRGNSDNQRHGQTEQHGALALGVAPANRRHFLHWGKIVEEQRAP
ncbi:hypothetical protein V8C42DRAFT_362021 [Trichoderma barbatum]